MSLNAANEDEERGLLEESERNAHQTGRADRGRREPKPIAGLLAKLEFAATAPRLSPAARAELFAKEDERLRLELRKSSRATSESHIPSRFRWSTFESPLLVKRVTPPSAVAACQALLPILGEKDFRIVLSGKSGTGKTPCAVALYRAALQHRPFGFYVSAYDVVEATYSYRGELRSVLERAENAPILLLDDVGAEADRDAEKIGRLLFKRVDAEHATILTTELGAADIRTRYQSRVAKRILSDARAVTFGGR